MFATLCIFLFLIFDLVPIPNSTYCKQFNNSGIYNALFQLYGAIFQFAFIGYFLWVSFTLLNILLVLCFPFEFQKNSRMRVFIFTIQFIVSIALPLFLVCVTLALWEGSPYQAYINIRLIAIKPDTNSLSNLLIYYSPLVLLTVAPILLCKFGWNKNSLNFVKPKSEKSFLESRIIMYSVSVLLIMIFLTICLIYCIKISKSDDYYSHREVGLCTTAQSPVTHQQNNSTILYNNLFEGLKLLQILSNSCSRIANANKAFPPVLYILDAFFIRIIIMCIFIFTLPSKSNCELWKSIIKGFYNKIRKCSK